MGFFFRRNRIERIGLRDLDKLQSMARFAQLIGNRIQSAYTHHRLV